MSATFVTRVFRGLVDEHSGYETARAQLIALAGGIEAVASGRPIVFRPAAKESPIAGGTFRTPTVLELRTELAAFAGLQPEDIVRRAESDLQAPSLKRERGATDTDHVAASTAPAARERVACTIRIANVVGESCGMHDHPAYAGGVFQAASQFNCLEFVTPTGTPELGIGCYERDATQGPACAIACAAGTAVRNYLVVVDPATEAVADPTSSAAALSTLAPSTAAQRIGQTRQRQINTLHDIQALLGPTTVRAAATGGGAPASSSSRQYFDVKNGYVDSDDARLDALNSHLVGSSRATLLDALRVGVMDNTQVTNRASLDGAGSPRLVHQVYGSAIPIGYTKANPAKWENLARLVLDGAYEATLLWAAIVAVKRRRRRAVQPLGPSLGGSSSDVLGDAAAGGVVAAPPPFPVLLTKLGGGVFRNRTEWIVAAIRRACRRVAYALDRVVPPHERDDPRVPLLDVSIVHFRGTEVEDYAPLARGGAGDARMA